jgi:O-methyltransferase
MNISGLDNEARRALLRELRGLPIEPLDAAFPQAVNIPSATYAPWVSDEAFKRLYDTIRPNTLVDVYRCYELWTLATRSQHVAGDVLEVGTWRGGTGSLLAAACARAAPEKTVFLCDTFAGVVKAGEKDTLYRGGEHADASRETVEGLLTTLQLTNVRILTGVFPEETGEAIVERRFALCHIDVDAYASGKDVFTWVASRLPLHGVVVFDDYGFRGCEGITRLVHELAEDERFFTYFNLNGHAVMLKVGL